MKPTLVQLFDTTLRDGQQCPGAGMSFEKNIEYALLAADVGIDVLEAGFAAASEAEFDIVNTILKEVLQRESCPVIASLCQLREQQIDITIDALLPGVARNKARLHTYLPVDPQLMQASLGHYADDKARIIDDVHRLIKRAADAGLQVEFSPEGYSRMGDNFDFATDVIRAAVTGGATIINCPDTIGGACRLQGDEFFVNKMQRHAEIIAREFPQSDVIWSAHCHNDFGLALDNSMSAVFAGPARQVEGCINGIGERAGNAALEQCIMYIKHFGHCHPEYAFYTNIKTELLKQLSDFVSKHMLPRQAHWPISGENAARHTSGGHTNAIINNPLAYQPFDPKEVGNEISFLFGPLSGGNHAKMIIERYGYVCDDKEKATIAQAIKHHYAERRKGITDDELILAYLAYRNPIKVHKFAYSHEGGASVLSLQGDFFDQPERFQITYESEDSALAALDHAVRDYFPGLAIENYNSEAVGKGIDAKSKTTIVITDQLSRLFTGIGIDQDIEISALKAFISAVNQAYIEEHYKQGEQCE